MKPLRWRRPKWLGLTAALLIAWALIGFGFAVLVVTACARTR